MHNQNQNCVLYEYLKFVLCTLIFSTVYLKFHLQMGHFDFVYFKKSCYIDVYFRFTGEMKMCTLGIKFMCTLNSIVDVYFI